MHRYFDVVIVGAGPAGSTLSYRLARLGVSVLVLDRAVFPRDKPCGGGITARGLHHLPIDVTPVVEDRVTSIQMSWPGSTPIVRSDERTIVYMTQRRRLDAHLMEQAVSAGVEFRDGCRVRSIEMSPDGGTVRTDGDSINASVVVGADGCNGISARALGLGGDVTYAVAYEGNVGWDTIDHDVWQGSMLFEFNVPGGYSWVFPKAEHANFGVGGWASEGPRIRQHLTDLCERHGVTEQALSHARGYRLPIRRPGVKVASRRALLIGDAAALVDPMSGDGMYEAFLSSRIASGAIQQLLDGRSEGLEPYQRALDGALSRHRAVSWGGKLIFDQWPRLASRIARSQWLWRKVAQRLQGNGSHRVKSADRPTAELLARAVYRPHRGDLR